jgi:hypothetical protein
MVPKQNPHQCSATGGVLTFRLYLPRSQELAACLWCPAWWGREQGEGAGGGGERPGGLVWGVLPKLV